VSALLYGFFACYAVTGKCDLRIDSEGRDIAVFSSLQDCQRFGSASSQQPPDAHGKWAVDAGHYYQCVALTPMPVAELPTAAETPRPVYKTTAEALQRDFQADPEGLTQKIGSAIVEVTGRVSALGVADGAALQLSGDTWDVTAWLTRDGVTGSAGLKKREHVTLRCDRIGTLVAASGRRPAVPEIRDCNLVKPGG
jgi:hypothetical protein